MLPSKQVFTITDLIKLIGEWKHYFEWAELIQIYNNEWNLISKKKNLSEKFIREFQNKVIWSYISRYQKLSEDLIREFKDKVNWNRVSMKKNLSKEFILEFYDYLDWKQILNHNNFLLDDLDIEHKNIILEKLSFMILRRKNGCKYCNTIQEILDRIIKYRFIKDIEIDRVIGKNEKNKYC